MVISKYVRYSGRVQGVGFRYTARSLAEGFAVAGYVRNLPGGDVELVAEGEPDVVQDFLESLARQMSSHIEKQEFRDETPGKFKGFSIRF